MTTETQTAVPEGFEPFAHDLGFASHVGPIYMRVNGTRVDLGFRVEAHHCNPIGICHGGMMMTVMDMAIGVGIAAHAGIRKFTPSVNLTYDFLRPGELGEWLQSDVDFAHTTRRTGFASGFLVGPKGPVMRANGICKIPTSDQSRFGQWESSRETAQDNGKP